MKEALYYNATLEQTAECRLCPHHCTIIPGKRGICRVRKNEAGRLITENYGKVCSMNFDPIEKKPLYHFYPGQTIFSIGSIGCNLRCKFCQNWSISQTGVDEHFTLKQHTPDEVVDLAASRHDNIGIAYTYNEPAVWFEYMDDIARLAKKRGLKNVMVTNGFIDPEPLAELTIRMDAFSVDLKAFTEEFYKTMTGSSLQPVLNTIKTIRKAGKHLEVTNLIITATNDDADDFSRMVDWLATELGVNTVLHISRYFPMYKMDKNPTPEETLHKFYQIAKARLNYVYLGNLHSGKGNHTQCPKCGHMRIMRMGYHTEIPGLDEWGRCGLCGEDILEREYV
jgi:pyruvate formate lyase activating enzyme